MSINNTKYKTKLLHIHHITELSGFLW